MFDDPLWAYFFKELLPHVLLVCAAIVLIDWAGFKILNWLLDK